jgi:hypothetical protein
MRRTVVSMLAVVGVVALAAPAWACDKDGKGEGCPGKHAKWSLSELKEGFLVEAGFEGTADEIKQKTDKLAAHLEGCFAGKCKCADKDVCPFNMDCLDYQIARTEKGLQVTVTGGCPGKRAIFKQRFDDMVAGAGCKGDGSCAKKPGCTCQEGEKKKDCDCGKKHEPAHSCPHDSPMDFPE